MLSSMKLILLTNHITENGRIQLTLISLRYSNIEYFGQSQITNRQLINPLAITSISQLISSSNILDMSITAIFYFMRTMRWWGRLCFNYPKIMLNSIPPSRAIMMVIGLSWNGRRSMLVLTGIAIWINDLIIVSINYSLLIIDWLSYYR